MAGNQTQVTNQLGQSTTSTFNRTGKVATVTDPRGTVTTFTYDPVDRIKTVGTTVQGTTTYTYNTAGRLTQRTDPLTHVTAYVYDVAGRLTKQTDPLGRFSTYTYDAAGNRVTSVNGVGNAGTTPNPLLGTITTTYDRAGRVTLVDYSDTTPDVATIYDPQGRVATVTDGTGSDTFSYDLLSRVSGRSGGASGTFAYTYDANGNVVSRSLSDGTVVTYGYDDEDRMSTVTAGGTTTTYTYDAASNLTSTVLPNGVAKTVTFDRAGRIATLNVAKGVTPIAGYTYTRDVIGNPTMIVATGTNVAGTRAFTYDNVNRVTAVCYVATTPCPAASKTAWTYNKVGGILTLNVAGVTTTNTYDNADQAVTAVTGGVTTNYTYDANGNQLTGGTRVSTYNAAMQTVSIKDGTNPATTYAYDGAGNRATATTGTTVNRFQWDRNNPLPLLAVERDTASAVVRRYVNGVEPVSLTSGATTSFYTTDEIGSISHVTHGTTGAVQWANTYTPFGTTKTSVKVDPAAPTNPFKFTGQYEDPTGLYNLRARLYNPTTGTFTQTDPMPYGPGSPFESLYVYGGNNPAVYTDPSGLRKTSCNTSLGRQAGASFLGLASSVVPFYNRDFSVCEARAVSKILAPATVVGSTLAAGSCGTLVGIGTLNPQMAAGAGGACGGVAKGVATGNLNLTDVSWDYAEGYSTAPPGNLPRPVSSLVDDLRSSEAPSYDRFLRLRSSSGRAFFNSPSPQYDWVDDLGRTYDQIGNPATSQYWSQQSQQFLGQIVRHTEKAGFAVVDLTGFARAHIREVGAFVDSLPASTKQKIIRIGF